MLNLSKEDRRELRDALTSGFRSYPALSMFVADNFDNLRLDEIAESKATKIAADNLIESCAEQGNESELILALHQERPNNPEVQKLMSRLQGFLQQRLLLDLNPTGDISLPFELPAVYDDRQLESFLPQPLSYEADVGKLRRGLQLANAVCKVCFSDRATIGTGVLVAPDLILTNYHILSRSEIPDRSQLIERAQTMLFEFGFVSQEHDLTVSPDTFAIDITNPIVCDSPTSALDYLLLRVEPKIKSCDYIQPVSIAPPHRILSPKDGLNMLQHPDGKLMQVSLSASGVVRVDESRGLVWYVNRTQAGSSGSPCFNSNWELIALHHASMSRGFGSIREGIVISSIVANISKVAGIRIG